MHAYTTPCIHLCGHPYVRVCCSSFLSECKCVQHAPLRSADFGFIMANMMQHYRKIILPVMPDMVLSAALLRIKTGIYCGGQAGQHACRQEGREGGNLNIYNTEENINSTATATLS